MLASLISAAFLGGSCRRPFLVVAAALALCLAFEDGDLDFKPLVLPWAISLMSRDRVMRPTLLASGIPGKGCGYWVRGRPPPHLRRRPRCCPHPTSCAPSARSSSSARYRTRLFSRHLFTVVFGLSVRCTISLPSLAEKRSSRLACQDTAPSAGTSSPYLDVQASLGDTSSLNSVRPRLSYLLRAPTDSQRDAPARMGTQVIVPYREEDEKRHLKPMGDLGQIVPMVPFPNSCASICLIGVRI